MLEKELFELNNIVLTEAFVEAQSAGEVVFESEQERTEYLSLLNEVAEVAALLEEYAIAELLEEGISEDYIIATLPYIVEASIAEAYKQLDSGLYVPDTADISSAPASSAEKIRDIRSRLNLIKHKIATRLNELKAKNAERLKKLKEKLTSVKDKVKPKIAQRAKSAKEYTKTLLAALAGKAITKSKAARYATYRAERAYYAGAKDATNRLLSSNPKYQRLI
jgi:hypothetical protein